MNRSARTYELITSILEDKNLSNMDKIVFMALVTFNGKDKIFPSRERICKRISTNRISTISRSLNKLQKGGYITIIRRKCSSNIYKINGISMLYSDDGPKPSDAPAEDKEFERAKIFLERQRKLREERRAVEKR